MKKKTIALFAVPAFILASTIGIAQTTQAEGLSNTNESSEHQSKSKHNGKKLARLAKKLDLNDDQKIKVKALFEQQQSAKSENMSERKALHQAIRDLDVNAADFQTKLAAVKDTAKLQAVIGIDRAVFMKQKMGEILSAEQLVKLEKIQQERSEHRNKRGGNNHSE